MRIRCVMVLLFGIGISAVLLSGCKSAFILGGPADPDRLIDGVYQGTYKNSANSALVEVIMNAVQNAIEKSYAFNQRPN